MQSLIHGNFSGAAQKKAYALVGASAAIAAAVGPLLGGFITTYLSWRVAFALEDVVIAVVLLGIRLVKDVPYTGPRRIDGVGAVLSVVGMGGLVLGILVWQEGGESVILLLLLGAVAMALFVVWLRRQSRLGKPTLVDPNLFRSKLFRFGVSEQMLQQIALGGAMIALPIYLQMVFEYNAMQAGLSLAPLSLSMFGVAVLAGKRGGRRRPASTIRAGFALVVVGFAAIIPIVPRADSGWYLVLPLLVVGSGLGMLVSQLNNYTLSPISEEHVSEAAGVNSAAGSFGLSFGLAFAGAILLAVLSLSFTNQANQSAVLTPAQQQQVSSTLEHDAEFMSNTQLEAQLAGQPKTVQAEAVRINTKARHHALQVALLVPLIAGLPRTTQFVLDDAAARPQTVRGGGHGDRLTETRRPGISGGPRRRRGPLASRRPEAWGGQLERSLAFCASNSASEMTPLDLRSDSFGELLWPHHPSWRRPGARSRRTPVSRRLPA